MNGQMKKYKESLQKTPGPVSLNSLPPVKLDLRGIMKYARQKGVQPFDLSPEEKKAFIK